MDVRIISNSISPNPQTYQPEMRVTVELTLTVTDRVEGNSDFALTLGKSILNLLK